MSLTTRILGALLLLLGIALALCTVYARQASTRALQAEQRLVLAVQAQTELKAALEAKERGQEALQRERQALEARLQLAAASGNQVRHDGEARAQAVLLAPVPDDTQDLVRWATAQEKALDQRLEVPR